MFDDALVESRKSHSLGGKRLSLPVAVGLHLAVIGAFVGASAWFTGDAPEPAERVVVCDLGSHLRPPAPTGGGETPRHTLSRAARTATQPARLPDATAVAVEDRPQSAFTDVLGEETGPGVPTGPDGGSGDPIEGGPGSGPGGGDSEVILMPGGDVHAPVLLERVEPDYPEAARRARMEGTLILEAVITASGTVQEVRVLRSVNPLLDEAAERAVRQWRYKPATLNGRAVPVYLTVTVRFGIAS